MLHKFHYSKLSSTQDQAKQLIITNQLLLETKSVAIITADAQSQGRGRYGKSWASPAGAGIYVTFVQNLATYKIADDFTQSYTILVAEILRQQLEQSFPTYTFEIKPINDIYYQGAKLAGILVETFNHQSELFVLTGIGINLLKSQYLIKESLPDSPKAAPIALAEIVGARMEDFDQNDFLEGLANALEDLASVYT